MWPGGSHGDATGTLGLRDARSYDKELKGRGGGVATVTGNTALAKHPRDFPSRTTKLEAKTCVQLPSETPNALRITDAAQN